MLLVFDAILRIFVAIEKVVHERLSQLLEKVDVSLVGSQRVCLGEVEAVLGVLASRKCRFFKFYNIYFYVLITGLSFKQNFT